MTRGYLVQVRFADPESGRAVDREVVCSAVQPSPIGAHLAVLVGCRSARRTEDAGPLGGAHIVVTSPWVPVGSVVAVEPFEVLPVAAVAAPVEEDNGAAVDGPAEPKRTKLTRSRPEA